MSLETYGRYQLIKKLATGGMAQIYLARQVGPEGFEKTLVVKRILPHLAENEDFITMFLDEARIAARLNHPNVVQIFDLGAQDDSYFIAMEYIHGEDARRVWKQSERVGRPIPQALICRMIIDACAGLDYAHKKADASGRPLNIVHRDISPQNILVSFEGVAKVVDFGIAKAADQATVTRSGVLKGKYSYMSPEQASGQPVDHRTDIFAIGVVLWELLTGERLFKRGTDIQTLNAVTDCVVPPPSSVRPGIPPELDEIVLKTLSRDRARRYQEAKHLAADLEDWLLKQQLPSSSALLAEFLHDIYADRLKAEAEEGRLLVESIEASRHDEEADRPERATPAPAGDPRRTRSLRAHQDGKSSKSDLRAVERSERSKSVKSAAGVSAVRSRASQVAPPPPRAEPRQTIELPPATPGRVVDEEAMTLPLEAAARRTMSEVSLGPPQAGARVGPLAAVAVGALVLLGLGVALAWQRGVFGGGPTQAGDGPAQLKVASVPPGATVLVDGAEACQTPCSPTLAAGAHRLELRKDGYQPTVTTVEAPAHGLVEPAPFSLVALAEGKPLAAAELANVTLQSLPAGARLYVDDKLAGTTPVTLRVPADALLAVRLELDGHASVSDRFRASEAPSKPYLLKAVGPKDQHPKPAPKEPEVRPVAAGGGTGTVRFSVSPWATVDCGEGFKFGQTPFADRAMPVGEYTCTFRYESATQTRSVRVKAGELTKVPVKFEE